MRPELSALVNTSFAKHTDDTGKPGSKKTKQIVSLPSSANSKEDYWRIDGAWRGNQEV
jgi:hypothetical protein